MTSDERMCIKRLVQWAGVRWLFPARCCLQLCQLSPYSVFCTVSATGFTWIRDVVKQKLLEVDPTMPVASRLAQRWSQLMERTMELLQSR